MGPKDDGLATGPEQLLAWWGKTTGNDLDGFEARFKRFQDFAADLQRASAEAASNEIGEIFGARDRFMESMRELVQSKDPEELLAAQAGIAASYFNVLAAQARRWANFAEKAHSCCAELAHDVIKTSRRPTKETDESKPLRRTAQAHEAPRHAAE